MTLGPLGVVAVAGGFIGFGGPFRRPPLPRVVAGRLVCTDQDATFELFADMFGTRFRPAAWAHAEATTATADASAAAVEGLDKIRGAVAAAACSGMVAVALGDSHKIFVLGRRERAR